MTQAGKNIILIGMPAVGKTTIGKMLASRLNRTFIDTDEYVERVLGKTIVELIAERSSLAYAALEESTVKELNIEGGVIATGGSVIYGEEAMKHLGTNGVIVHLDLPYADIERRIDSMASRGVVRPNEESLEQLYSARRPLYLKHEHVRIACSEKSPPELVDEIVDKLRL